MFWNCSICVNILDLSKPICSTPCGHLFHRECLETWLLRSRTCPECRTSIKSASLKRVFPNGGILSGEMYITQKADAVLKEIRELQEKYNKDLDIHNAEVDKKIKEHKEEILKEFKDIKEYASKFKSKAALYKQLAELSLKKMELLEIKNKNLKVELTNLNAENELYKNVKTIVQGEQQEVNNIIIECQNDRQSGCNELMQNLATFLAVLKRECNMLVITKNNKESISLKSNLSVMNEKFSKLQKKEDGVKVKNLFQKEDVPSEVLGNNCLNDSPIAIKLMEKKKKLDDIVRDDNVGGKPSFNPAKIENQDFLVKKSKVGFPIAVGPNLHNDRIMIHTDPKLVRRIKLRKKIIK